MGTIMYKKVQVGGSSTPVATEDSLGIVKPDNSTVTIDADGTLHSSGDSGVELTQAEYNALEAEGKVDPNTTYYIKDGGSGGHGTPVTATTLTQAQMGIIMRNNVSYSGGGSGDTSAVEMTKAEYASLTPEQKNDGTIRFIVDDESEIDAHAVVYDNSESTLQSTNVQDAIDEVAARESGSGIQSITQAAYDALEDKSGAYFIEDSAEDPLDAFLIDYRESNVGSTLDSTVSEVSALTTTVGNSTSGLVKRVADLESSDLESIARKRFSKGGSDINIFLHGTFYGFVMIQHSTSKAPHGFYMVHGTAASIVVIPILESSATVTGTVVSGQSRVTVSSTLSLSVDFYGPKSQLANVNTSAS